MSNNERVSEDMSLDFSRNWSKISENCELKNSLESLNDKSFRIFFNNNEFNINNIFDKGLENIIEKRNSFRGGFDINTLFDFLKEKLQSNKRFFIVKNNDSFWDIYIDEQTCWFELANTTNTTKNAIVSLI